MNPYGIEQVDVPGLLAVYQGAQDRRAQQMLMKRQQEAAEKQADRDQRFGEILAKGMGAAYGSPQAPQGGMGGVYGGGSLVATPEQMSQQSSLEAEFAGRAPVYAQDSRPTNFQLSPETMAQLIALDPKQATEIIGAFKGMNEAQHAASQQVNETLGRTAQYLLGVPEAERAAEIQRIAPELMRHGINEQQITQFAPTDRNLQYMVAQARDIEKLREEAMPKLRNVGPGEMIIDERRIGQGDATVYRSPLVKGPDGALFERVPDTGGGQSEAELRAAADAAIRQGADPAAVNARLNEMLKGGTSGNAGGGFP